MPLTRSKQFEGFRLSPQRGLRELADFPEFPMFFTSQPEYIKPTFAGKEQRLVTAETARPVGRF